MVRADTIHASDDLQKIRANNHAACEKATDGESPVVIGVFYNVKGSAVPNGCFAIQLEAVTCTSSTCA